MDNRENELILSFDMLYTSNHIQILKVLLPCFEPQIQKKLAVMIKFLEFQYTLDYFRANPNLPDAGLSERQSGSSGETEWDIVQIFSRIRSFCTPTERAMFDQLTNLKKNMDMYEEMMNMMQLFSSLTGNTAADSYADAPQSSDGFNPMEMLKNMLSPEQQTMFDMFQAALPTENQ